MKPIEHEEGKRDTGDDTPGQETHEPELELLGEPTLGDERVECPQSAVAAQEKRDHLQTDTMYVSYIK